MIPRPAAEPQSERRRPERAWTRREYKGRKKPLHRLLIATIATVVLVVGGGIVAPSTVSVSALQSMLPFFAILAVAVDRPASGDPAARARSVGRGHHVVRGSDRFGIAEFGGRRPRDPGLRCACASDGTWGRRSERRAGRAAPRQLAGHHHRHEFADAGDHHARHQGVLAAGAAAAQQFRRRQVSRGPVDPLRR